MSASERAAELRAQADALDGLADLEADLLAAKSNYADDPSPEVRAAKQDAALALRSARELVRADRVSLVGGDAVVSDGAGV